MGEYPTKREALRRGKKLVVNASSENTSEEVMICRASISIDESPDHDCVYLQIDGEIIGSVIEGVTHADPDEELIHLLTQVLAENFRETDQNGA